MAITVIKYGRKREATCSRCEAKLAYEKDDIQMTVDSYYNERSETHSIVCPICDTCIIVSEWK